MKKKYFIILLATLLLITILPISTFAEKNDSEGTISENDAKKAAAWHVLNVVHSEDENKNWGKKDFKVKKPIRIYDPAGNHVAYIVDIMSKDDSSNGFVMVSAFENDDPIIMWNEEYNFFFNPKDQKYFNENKDSKIKEYSIVWLGGTYFSAKFILKNGDIVYVDQDNNETSEDLSSLVYPNPKEDKEIQKLWKKIRKIGLGAPGQTNPIDGVTTIDPVNWETNYLRIDKDYIQTPNQKQWYYDGVRQATGCSPTAASNIIAYWASNGYPGLNPTNNQRDIVMSLRTYMKTTQDSNGTGLTQPYNIDNGLQSYSRAMIGTGVATNVTFASYNNYKDEISLRRPALQSYWNQYFFGDHTVTAVGYKSFVRLLSSSDYIVVKNNYIGEVHTNMYVRWGTWNANTLTTFRPR